LAYSQRISKPGHAASLSPSLGPRLARWFFEGVRGHAASHAHSHTTEWWKVMCLTGVDYFSTLAYQPSIAFMAAGVLSPIATFVLVALTLFGALPMYSRIATVSPHGQGSIVMLEDLFPKWAGKVFVLCLLGFAATDFVITITLSAADATAHMVENPFTPVWLNHPMTVTLMLLVVLGLVFLRGFSEAIMLAFVLVFTYLSLNVIVIGVSLYHVWVHPELLSNWKQTLFMQHASPVGMLLVAMLLFPKLALGLSGFETGVAVMPLVRGDAGDTEEAPLGRIRNTKKLLATAALIMSVMLMGSSFVASVIIPASAFQPHQPADGRAIAYLAHELLGTGFGTLYDVATIAILWFAGASAMAGLLNLVPRYLPRYGMAPEWARATRPLVALFTGITILVTIIFDANVDAQGGAYATGVLVLMSSAALAVALMSWRDRRHYVAFSIISAVFVYTTVTNIFERPEGIKIASVFILTIILTSLVSRALRSTELRVGGIVPDDVAAEFIAAAGRSGEAVRIIANRPRTGAASEYATKLREASDAHHIPPGAPVLFLEIRPGDASQFTEVLRVQGLEIDGYRVLRCQSPAIPNAIAAMLLHIRDKTGQLPHVYFGWTEGNPITYLLKFLAFGEGDTAPVTREVLRQSEPDPMRRPRVHVG
jgi:hypothetical protein